MTIFHYRAELVKMVLCSVNISDHYRVTFIGIKNVFCLKSFNFTQILIMIFLSGSEAPLRHSEYFLLRIWVQIRLHT